MTKNYWFYFKNIFINPVAAAKAVIEEQVLWRVMLWSFLLGCVPYWIIVFKGYQNLGWDAFPYKTYYPHYFSPYWWELLVVPIWGLVIAFGFGIPCYFLGRLFKGQATFTQVLTVVLLAAVVSLPIVVTVDLLDLRDPADTVDFAKTGQATHPYEPGESRIAWLIQETYFYVAMTWQGIVTLIGLSVIHRIRWYWNIPGLVAGNIIFFGFLMLIKDYVALII